MHNSQSNGPILSESDCSWLSVASNRKLNKGRYEKMENYVGNGFWNFDEKTPVHCIPLLRKDVS